MSLIFLMWLGAASGAVSPCDQLYFNRLPSKTVKQQVPTCTPQTTMYLVEAQLGKIGRCVQSEKRKNGDCEEETRSELSGVLERDCMK